MSGEWAYENSDENLSEILVLESFDGRCREEDDGTAGD
jgi:hypothetical protein